MDELEISGKRYISAKRIAKENKYHSDYIGQLIRGGKIAGTKVGRAWYVEEQSFADYLTKESKTYKPHVVEVPVHIKQVEVVQHAVEHVSPPVIPATQELPVVQEKVFVTTLREEKEFAPVKKMGLTYVSDAGPLFPEINKPAKDIARTSHVAVAVAHEPDMFSQIPETNEKGSRLGRVVATTALVFVGTALAGFVFFASVGINSTVVTQKGKPASVAYTQEKTFCFIFNSCQK
jgi:hypothetical protein